MNLPTNDKDIWGRVQNFDPLPYARTRNFGDGQVSYLSPYISRGVISTLDVFNAMKLKGYPFEKIEKFIQELAWRDYWQLVWKSKGNLINRDLKSAQTDVLHHQMPVNLETGKTGIQVVDKAISELKESGYMHNHMRMYVAALACNNAKSHWETPAKWMYYHLLDADWASNALSWQWVAGSNSNKKYIANQDNINKYFSSAQKGTILDKSYEEIAGMDCPSILTETLSPELNTKLPEQEHITLDPDLPTLIYNEYNLDPNWRKEIKANRVLLLDPKRFETLPMNSLTIQFILDLSRNIDRIKVFLGAYNDLIKTHSIGEVYYKEHPLNHDYLGHEDSRDWLSSVKGYYPSFFSFWKKCKKEIIY